MNVQHTVTESTNSSNQQVAADTRLYGRWLMFARVGWFVLVVLALAVFVASLPVYIVQLQSVCNGTACATGQLTFRSWRHSENWGFPLAAMWQSALHLPSSRHLSGSW